MNARIEITLGDDNGTAAPLYREYPQQYGPQPAYLEFDPSAEGPLALVAYYNGEIGNAVPADVWGGRIIRISVPSNARRDWLLELGQDEALAALLERVRAGYEGSDPYSRRATYSDDACAALEAIADLEQHWASYDHTICASIYTAQDWYDQDSEDELMTAALQHGDIASLGAANHADACDVDGAAVMDSPLEFAGVLADRLAEHVRHYICTEFSGNDQIRALVDLLISYDADEYTCLRSDYDAEFAPPSTCPPEHQNG